MTHSADGPPERTPARQWPGRWVREESFWRSVRGEALGAVLAALVIYIFLLAAGYIRRPNVWPVVLTASLGVLAASIGVWLGRQQLAQERRRFREQMKKYEASEGDLAEKIRQLAIMTRTLRDATQKLRRRALLLLVMAACAGVLRSSFQLWR